MSEFETTMQSSPAGKESLLILDSPESVAPYVQDIRQLADQHRKELGFLPASAYHEQAAHNHLWVAINSETRQIAGFLLYGGTFPNLRIFQLFVIKENRGKGVGKLLLHALKSFGENHNFLTLTAKVAAELPANKFWDQNGFRIVNQIRGGVRRKGRITNLRLYELDSPALFRTTTSHPSQTGDGSQLPFFNAPLLSNRTYVLDLNVFFDLIRRRLNKESAQRVIAAALDNEIRVLVTPEFSQELERHTNNSGNDPILEFSRALPTLPHITPHLLDQLTTRLRTIIFPHRSSTGKQAPKNNSDLLHLAYCIHHGARGFLTREKAILRHGENLREEFGIDVLAPSDLLDSISRQQEPLAKRTLMMQLRSGIVSLDALDESGRAAAVTCLETCGLTPQDVVRILDPGTSTLPRSRIIAKCDHVVVGVASWNWTSSEPPLLTAHVYADEQSPAFDRVVDHFLECLQREGRPGYIKTISIWCAAQSLKMRETLRLLGFQPSREPVAGSNTEQYSKASLKSPITKSNWSNIRTFFNRVTGYQLAEEMPTYAVMRNTGIVFGTGRRAPVVVPLFDFETLVSPGFALGAGRGGVLIPIREGYARNLLGASTIQLDLLPSHEALFCLEKAYFLAAGKAQLFPRGTLIVFYVSGTHGGRKQAVGIGRATYADTISVEQAQVTLVRQGVLHKSELQKIARKTGKLTAFAFDNFLAFPRPVPYSTLKELDCIGPANLVTAEELTFKQLERIITYAFSETSQ